MRSAAKVIILGLGLLLIWGCGEQTTQVSGVVTVSESRETLRDVEVTLGENTTTTASDGEYRFKDVRSGDYVLKVQIEGYQPYRKQIVVDGKQRVICDISLLPELSQSETPIEETKDLPVEPPPNQSPEAFIVLPADGSTFLEGEVVSFQGSGHDPEDGSLTNVSLVWVSSLDGQFGTGKSFTRNDLSVGTHVITLVAVDSQGSHAESSSSITIIAQPNEQPRAVISVSSGSGNAPLDVIFDGAGSQDPDGEIAEYVWDFGDGSTSVGKKANHTYVKEGTYTAVLKVVDDFGAEAQDSVNIDVVATSDTVSPCIKVPEDFQTIQAAIDAASPGSEIVICKGTYVENLVIDKDLVFRGVGMKKVTLKGKVEEAPAVLVGPSMINVTIQGMTITSGYYSIGVSTTGDAQLVLYECIVKGNEDGGIELHDAAQAKISSCVILENDYGVRLEKLSRCVISSSLVTDNGSGVDLAGASAATITRSVVSGGVTAEIRDTSDLNISDTWLIGRLVLHDSSEGTLYRIDGGSIYLSDFASLTMTESSCVVEVSDAGHAVICDCKLGQLEAEGSAQVEVHQCAITSSSQCVSLGGTSHTTLTDCLIRESSTGSGIKLYDGAELTVARCAIVGTEAHVGIYADDSSQVGVVDSVIKGEHIGITVETAAQATLKNCVISNCEDDALQIGLNSQGSSKVTVEDSTIEDSGTGLNLLYNASATMERCTIRRNSHGISIGRSGNYLRIEDSDVHENNIGMAIRPPAYGSEPFTAIVEGHAYVHDNVETESSPPFLDAPWPDGFVLDFLPSTRKNTPPVAIVLDHRVFAPLGHSITLSGDSSYDLDGDPLSYEWKQISGPVTVLIPGSEHSHVDLDLPLAGKYTFQLSVTDGTEESKPDSVVVQILPGFTNTGLFPAQRDKETSANDKVAVSEGDAPITETGFVSYKAIVAALAEPSSKLREQVSGLEEKITQLTQTYAQVGGYSEERLREIYKVQLERLNVLFKIDKNAIDLLASMFEFSSDYFPPGVKRDCLVVKQTLEGLENEDDSISLGNFYAHLFRVKGILGKIESQLALLLREEAYQIVKALAIHRGVAIILEVSPEILFASDALVDLTDVAVSVVNSIVAQGNSKPLKWSTSQNKNEKLKIAYVNLSKVISLIEPTDSELLDYYEAHVSHYRFGGRVRASHILVRDEQTAWSILAKLGDGVSFAELARKSSTDPWSSDKGGDLGWFERGQMVKEFEDAVFALEVGEVSDIVETRYGYHIIKLTDAKLSSRPSLEEVKDWVRTDFIKEEGNNVVGVWYKQGDAQSEVKIAIAAAREVAEALGYDLVVSSQDVAVFSPADQFVDLAGLSDGFTDITDFIKDVFTDYAR